MTRCDTDPAMSQDGVRQAIRSLLTKHASTAGYHSSIQIVKPPRAVLVCDLPYKTLQMTGTAGWGKAKTPPQPVVGLRPDCGAHNPVFPIPAPRALIQVQETTTGAMVESESASFAGRRKSDEFSERIAEMAGAISNPCPYVQNPFSECHVSRMDSQSIAEAVYYCAAHYEECRLYRQAPETATGAEEPAEKHV